jgi:lipoprotein-anchoring transpeptidase ErfK/SrfK
MTRTAAIALALVAIVAGVAGAIIGTPWDKKAPSAASASDAAATAPSPTDPTLSVVATAAGPSVPVYAALGGALTQTLPNPIPDGAPLTFLVRESQGAWLRVLLPLRPNGATGWIRTSDVRLTSHHFRIKVQLAAHRLTVTDRDHVILDTPVGVGTTDTPTPGGLYYTKELLQPPDPNGPYGHFTYGLSGFSNVLTDFAGGDGVIGIHGTNDPSTIGKDVSHGCLRISNDAIDMLAKRLPLGVPVEIDP